MAPGRYFVLVQSHRGVAGISGEIEIGARDHIQDVRVVVSPAAMVRIEKAWSDDSLRASLTNGDVELPVWFSRSPVEVVHVPPGTYRLEERRLSSDERLHSRVLTLVAGEEQRIVIGGEGELRKIPLW